MRKINILTEKFKEREILFREKKKIKEKKYRQGFKYSRGRIER